MRGMITRALARLTREAFYLSRPGTRRAAVFGVYFVFRVMLPASWLTVLATWWVG